MNLINHDDALAAEGEFEKFRVMEDQQPSRAELDFRQAVVHVKRLGMKGKLS